MSRTFPRPSSFKPERVVSTPVVWLTLRTSDRAWLNLLLPPETHREPRAFRPLATLQPIRARHSMHNRKNYLSLMESPALRTPIIWSRGIACRRRVVGGARVGLLENRRRNDAFRSKI